MEPEPDVRYGTHLIGALTPQAGAKANCVPAVLTADTAARVRR